MFKLITTAAIVALLCACSSMSGGSMSSSSGMSRTTMGAPGSGMYDSNGSGGAGGPN